MENEENKIENLIAKALEKKAQIAESVEGDQCLTDEVIVGFYEDTLSQDQRSAALEHLDKCNNCKNDLAFYFEMMASQVKPSISSKLKALKSMLPGLAKKFDIFDFKALCDRIDKLIDQIKTGVSPAVLNNIVGEIMGKLQIVSPVPVLRGQEDVESEELSYREISALSMQLKVAVEESLREKEIQINRELQPWAGLPELWIFDHLTVSMRQEAVCIRDWCEQQLEVLSCRQGYLPLVGVGHSKRMLSYAVSLFKTFERHIDNPFSRFSIYACCYCYHLGMLLETDKSEYEKSYTDPGKQTHAFIMGDHKKSILPKWQSMGFSGQQEAMFVADICAGCQQQSQGYTTALPKIKTIFLNGCTMTVPMMAISQILRLADFLDCDCRRLSNISNCFEMPKELTMECLKHELVNKVEIDDSGRISIAIKQRYEYPQKHNSIRSEIAEYMETKINEVRYSLSRCGIVMPSAQIEMMDSLFFEKDKFQE